MNRITLIKLNPQSFILKRSRIVRSIKYLSSAAATGGFFTLRAKKNKSRILHGGLKDAKPQRVRRGGQTGKKQQLRDKKQEAKSG